MVDIIIFKIIILRRWIGKWDIRLLTKKRENPKIKVILIFDGLCQKLVFLFTVKHECKKY